MAYNFKQIFNPIIRRLFETIFDVSAGHDHDGSNSKLITAGSAPEDGAVTNAKLATDVKVGSLATLNTTAKSSVVAAINEVDTNADTANTGIGTLGNLSTTVKTNLVLAVNETYAAVAGAAEVAADAAAEAASASSAVAAKVSLTGVETLTNKTLTAPVVASIYQDAGKTKLMTLPDTASDTLAAIAATQTLTNKSLTSPKITDGDAGVTITSADQTNGSATVTIPDIGDAADEFVMKDTTQTLTLKTLTSAILNTPVIGDADLGVIITSANQTYSAQATLTIPDCGDASDTFTLIDTAQTLTNKTLTAPVITSANIGFHAATHDYAAGSADWTLDATELKAAVLSVTNANAPANIVVPDTAYKPYFLVNGSGQTITVKTATGTGISIATAKSALVMSDGTNVIRFTADA